MTIRIGVVGLLGLGLWSCGGTVTHGDPASSDTDTSGWANGTDGDGSGDFGNNDGSGGMSTGGGGGSDTTGDDSGSAVTTRGSGTRNSSATSTTSGSSEDSSAAVSGSSSAGIGSGAGGQVATSSGIITAVSSVSTGSGGFGGDTTSGVSTFNSISVVTSTTGVGGTGSTIQPDLDDFPYLDDCDSSYWSVSTQYCNLGFECPSHTGWTNCWDLGNGELSCDCGRDYFWANYRLSGTNTADACAQTASACVAGPDVEGQPTCTPSYLYQSTNYCNATASCQSKVDIEGADIVKTGSHYVYCEERDDAWTCDCDIADGRVSVTLDASSGSSDMCVDALDWCSGEITREGARDCTPSSQYAETNSCYVNLRCSQAAVAGGVPATITESFTVNCRHDDAGTWICDCPGMGSFEVEAETGWDACTLGASECSPV
ncbi:MAG TPA: hypothetical protein VFU02_02600 [Polyangiaceae bacterium]|nr:hypothetical protein [Polyangiaceae bacterium]